MFKAIKFYFQKENKCVESANMFSNTWFMFTRTSESGNFGRFREIGVELPPILFMSGYPIIERINRRARFYGQFDAKFFYPSR